MHADGRRHVGVGVGGMEGLGDEIFNPRAELTHHRHRESGDMYRNETTTVQLILGIKMGVDG